VCKENMEGAKQEKKNYWFKLCYFF
jgi:hypothetical protein